MVTDIVHSGIFMPELCLIKSESQGFFIIGQYELIIRCCLCSFPNMMQESIIWLYLILSLDRCSYDLAIHPFLHFSVIKTFFI